MIKASAIMYNGTIYTGIRHGDIIHQICVTNQIENVPASFPQGFIDDENHFLNRKEAATHALACKQIKWLKYSDKELYSEDLW